MNVAATESLSAKEDREVALYESVLATYAPGTPAHKIGEDGYTVVLSFARAMKDLRPTDITPAGITQALLSMAPQPMVNLSGQTFQCNRKISTLTPAVCSTGATIITLDAAGDAKHSEVFDAAPYLSLG